MEREEPGAAPAGRQRLIAAAVAGASLFVVIAVVALTGSSGDGAGLAEPADEACIEAWNSDVSARAYGRHNFSEHGYARAQVLRIDEAGAPDPEGACAVVFAAQRLDPEPVAAGQFQRGGTWVPFTTIADGELDLLADLQSAAVERANAQLQRDGTIVAGA